jgi:drug/metabolite transporter (DMT)-like permease
VGAVLYIGVGASVAAYFLWARALEQAGPTMAGLIYYTLPLFSGLEAVALLGEPLTWVHATSGALIVGGIALATLRRGS